MAVYGDCVLSGCIEQVIAFAGATMLKQMQTRLQEKSVKIAAVQFESPSAGHRECDFIGRLFPTHTKAGERIPHGDLMTMIAEHVSKESSRKVLRLSCHEKTSNGNVDVHVSYYAPHPKALSEGFDFVCKWIPAKDIKDEADLISITNDL